MFKMGRGIDALDTSFRGKLVINSTDRKTQSDSFP